MVESGSAHALFGSMKVSGVEKFLLFTFLWNHSCVYLAINVLVLNYLFRRRLQCQME